MHWSEHALFGLERAVGNTFSEIMGWIKDWTRKNEHCRYYGSLLTCRQAKDLVGNPRGLI